MNLVGRIILWYSFCSDIRVFSLALIFLASSEFLIVSFYAVEARNVYERVWVKNDLGLFML